MLIFIGLIFTYIVSSVVIFLFVARLTQATEEKAVKLFLLTFGLGPITISWFLTKLLNYFPGHSNLFYLGLTVSYFVPLSLYGLNKFHLIKYLFYKIIDVVSQFQFSKHRLETAILLLVFIVLASIFFQATMQPLTANDPLEYATDSRLIYEYRTTEVYPFNKADLDTGYYAPSSHPLGYISLMVWSYMLQGSSEHAGLIKLISPIYVFHILLLLWYVLSRRGNIYGIMGMLLLATTPLFHSQSAVCHIDPIRMYTFFLAFVWLCEIVKHGNLWSRAIAGFAVGMSMFSHSLGFLALPLFVFIYYVISNDKHSKRLLSLMVIVSIALLIGGSRYVSNFQDLGTPLSDKVVVYELESMDYKNYLRQERGLSTVSDRLIFGVLKGFSKIRNFGLSYCFFALALIFYFRLIKTDMVFSTFLCVVILFYALVFFSFILGADILIKNDRYLITIQPFIAYFGAILLGASYEKMVNN